MTYLVVSVGEVETGDVHAGVKHLHEHVHVPAGGSEGADNLRLALVHIDLLKDVLETNVAGISATLGCFDHLFLLFLQKCVLNWFWTCSDPILL